MAGLGILVFFALVAVLAPVLFPPETISVTQARLTETAVELLCRRMGDQGAAEQPPVSMVIPFELVLRKSTAPPRREALVLSTGRAGSGH